MSDEAEQKRLEKVEHGQQVESGETVEAFFGGCQEKWAGKKSDSP